MEIQFRFTEEIADGLIYTTPQNKVVLVCSSYNILQNSRMLRKKYSNILFQPQKELTDQQLRTIIQKKWCDAILDIDGIYTKDHIKQYDSFASNVVLKMCAENSISILVSLSSLQNPPFFSYRSRVLQTKRLCKKYKTLHEVVSLIGEKETWYSNKDLNAISKLILT